MDFVPGIELNHGFFEDVVKPLIAAELARLRYSAALIGYGSDVLGYDNATSMDHNWGPRMQLFLDPADYQLHKERLDECLRRSLPAEYRGFPTNFTDPRYDRTQSMHPTSSPPINHLIEITTPQEYLSRHLGVSSTAGLSHAQWIGFREQNLLELTSGIVFYDGLGEVESMREDLQYFPAQVRIARMGLLWKRIQDEEPFIGRHRETGTATGAKLIAARLADNAIRIAFHLSRRYAPYSKWRWRAFEALSCFARLSPWIETALQATETDEIEEALATTYATLVEIHNEDKSLPQLNNRIRHFFGRPYKVIFAESIVEAIEDAVTDPGLRSAALSD